MEKKSPEIQSNTVNNNSNQEKKARTALMLGILGMFAWIIPAIGLPIQIVGLVKGIKSIRSSKHKYALIGIILCSIGIFASVTNGVIGAYLGATGQHELVNQILSK